MTQQNAALVEEAAAAADALQEQSQALARVVSAFTLSGHSQEHGPGHGQTRRLALAA